MNISTILKGAAVAASFAFFVSEASAQLPVRTRQLQLLGSTSGTLTHTAAATTTPHTLTWPAALPAATFDGVLRTNDAGTLSWYPIAAGDDIITGDGDAGEVAYFGAGNTITSSPTMTFNGSGDLGLGDITANPGTIALGDGNSNTGTFQTADLTGNQTYTFPDASGNVPVSTNIGTVGQILIANADGTSTWTTSDVANFRTGEVTMADATFSINVIATVPNGATVKAFTAQIIDADGTITYVTSAAIAATTFTGTVQTTVPVTGAKTVYWMLTFNP